MMNLRHLLRACVPCLLLAVAPLLSHCGEAAGFGTETGNPPQLEAKQLSFELVDGGIRVIGKPGAVAPPGASVRITNLTSGASVETTAAADGSIDVVIAGEGGDELEVTVTSGGRQTSERVSSDPVAGSVDLNGGSCPGLEDTLNQTVGDVLDSADVVCTTDVDCVSVYVGAGAQCYQGCGSVVLSRNGAAFASAEGERRTAAICAALDGCDRPPPPPCDQDDSAPQCVAGRCEAVDLSSLSCDDLLQSVEARRSELRDRANKGCVLDADCALAEVSVSCLIQCDTTVEGVARTAVAGLEAAVRDEVDSAYCGWFVARGCRPPEPGCPQPSGIAEAFCDAGTCSARFVQ
jgi:hypothetical protein